MFCSGTDTILFSSIFVATVQATTPPPSVSGSSSGSSIISLSSPVSIVSESLDSPSVPTVAFNSVLHTISAISAGVVCFTVNVAISGFLSNFSTIFFAISASFLEPIIRISFLAGLVTAISDPENPGRLSVNIFLFKNRAIAAASTYFTGIKLISCFIAVKF